MTTSSEVIWECKIGGPVPGEMPNGWDSPMRRAVQAAFLSLTGVDAEFTFSGRGQLTEGERAVVEKRAPTSPASGALPAEMREALRLAREYVRTASVSYYDGTNGEGMRAEAARRLKLIDAALASREASSADATNMLVRVCHEASASAGWWNDTRPGGVNYLEEVRGGTRFGKALVAEKLCLAHSEISEAMEGHRKNLPDDKLPHRSMIEVEIADAVIRLFDLAGALQLDLGGALAEKMAFNAVRPDHKLEARGAAGGKAY